jgi:hypothetical protein
MTHLRLIVNNPQNSPEDLLLDDSDVDLMHYAPQQRHVARLLLLAQIHGEHRRQALATAIVGVALGFVAGVAAVLLL